MTDRGVDGGHDLFGHQLHRPAAELLVFPVLAGIKQCAEIARDLAEGEDLIDDAVHVARDDEIIDDEIEIQVLVREIAFGLEDFVPVAFFSAW